MRAVIFAGGPGIDIERAASIASSCDFILAADSGAAVAAACGLVPDKIVGDLDSIDAETRAFMESRKVPFEVYPSEKDMTDTEICVKSLPEDAQITLVCSFSGRPDHALSLMMLAVKEHAEGRDITLTDGVNDFIPMCGPDEISISGLQDPESLVISLIPFTEVKGVTTEGLYYKLEDSDLIPGSSYSVSNRVGKNQDFFRICVKHGKMGVMIVPET